MPRSAHSGAHLSPATHPTVELGVPEVVLPGFIKGLKARPSACGLTVSLTRGAAAERIINAPPGQFSVALGYTGTPIRSAIDQAARAARMSGARFTLEADHASIWVSSASHVRRAFGQPGETTIDRRELAQSIDYLGEAIDEAAATGRVTAFTIDAVDLIHERAAQLETPALKQTFDQLGTPTQRRAFFQHYAEKPLRVPRLKDKSVKQFMNENENGCENENPATSNQKLATSNFTYRYDKNEVRQLALMYWDSLQRARHSYERIHQRMAGREYGIEISLAETAQPTSEKELLFYLNELKRRKIPFDFVAPNLGLRPHQEFDGKSGSGVRRLDAALNRNENENENEKPTTSNQQPATSDGKLKVLRERLERLAAIAASFDGARLSVPLRPPLNAEFIAGGEAAKDAAPLRCPPGLLKAFRKNPGGPCRIKLADVFNETILRVLSHMPRRSASYNIYSRIFDSVQRFLRVQSDNGGDMVDLNLPALLGQYDRDLRERKCAPRDPDAEFFRIYSPLAMNLRDMRGNRHLRQSLIELHATDKNAREKINTAVERVTIGLLEQLGAPALLEEASA